MHAFWRDVRYGLRMLAKNPGFTVVAVLTLALGVGATTAIFSVIYGVLLRPLPYTHPEEIVHLWEMSRDGHHMNFADPNFADMQSQNRSLRAIAEYGNLLESVSGGKEPTRTMVAPVSRDFFAVMGVQPAIGRGFAAEEQRYNAPSRGTVLGMVLKQGVITGALGVGIGILSSLSLTRWLQSQLFGVSPTDPATFAGVALILILASLAACWIPGRRAARVDPIVALRYE
jgi:hypothetical protein